MWASSFWGKGECGPTLHEQHVGTINRSLNSVAKQMERLAKANNTCNSEKYETGFPKLGIFCLTPYNSNSYAFSVVEELMGRRPEPEPGTWLKYGGCEFDSAHGWDKVVNLNGC